MSTDAILAIDQGTTSSRAIVFDTQGNELAKAQQEFPQIFPQDGWVEHDPEEIWQSTVAVCGEAVQAAQAKGAEIKAAGITNQRETTVVWDRETGEPIHNAIVWQDRRGAEACERLHEEGAAREIEAKTGLVPDSYFSATKLNWLLNNVDGARARAEAGSLAFGTIDTFLLWRLTGGTSGEASHATDASNASRTMLFNIHDLEWDSHLLELFEVPEAILPEVWDSDADFGAIQDTHFGLSVPVTGIAGDQQAAAFGQACFDEGMAKATYGTGCFLLANTGEYPPELDTGLLGTIAWQLGGEVTYASEGSVFNAGTALQWLRDKAGFLKDAGDSEAIAAAMESSRGVVFVPAFTGLGAPHWDPEARGAIFGLTRDSAPDDIIRAALEAVVYQTRDLIDAMDGLGDDVDDGGVLRVDGGMVANNWLMQYLADMTRAAVERPVVTETTALGAALLAGFGAGLYDSLDDVEGVWKLDRRFEPAMEPAERRRNIVKWRDAVERLRTV